MFPENIIEATFQQVETEYVEMKDARGNPIPSLPKKRTLKRTREMNVLGERLYQRIENHLSGFRFDRVLQRLRR